MKPLDKQLHDIRKPLNTITMQAELIKMIEEAKGADANLLDAATKIIKNAKDCSAQLEDLFLSIQQTTSTKQDESN